MRIHDIIKKAHNFFSQSWAITAAELWKLRHDPTELMTRAIQPLLWLLLFGQVMARVRGMTPGNEKYLDFLAPGILAQSVLFAAIFYGIGAIWERDLGILNRYLVSPAPRTALVLGKAYAAAIRGLVQAVIVYIAAFLMGVDLNLNVLNIAGVAVLIGIGSALFSMFSLIIACIVRTRERFMGIGQVLTMPIFFASNAIYPISLMPQWLKIVSLGNPLTYEVDALRTLMLTGMIDHMNLSYDFMILTGMTFIMIFIAAYLYPRMAY
jgi:ABC-2 type transport system permease protein